ncbi:anaphase-promoting complex subunit 1 isoform X2 [Solanum pennellii]|uniref:Anaphase-promoting complex subunit 1 isoform X2 n=1 Tax=Solanum pennellii TaxID=28526 RepID=A0ABM1H3L2_SOLPN|nr:anaphase-promoting complex subunit 1 isoform X2 [Solanum pennellii]
MSIGARELTILGDFKPFGLIAEALDGKPSDTCVDDYRYFLFSPEVTKQRDEADELDLPSPSDRSDHELFIRGNKIIWSIGSRVYKRFTSPSTVIKACWCRMGDTSDTVLCILQSDSLSIYDTSGEVTSVPLPRSITSIWPLPYGLLLQQAPEGSSQSHIHFSSLSPLLSARNTIRSKRDVSTQQNYTAVHGLDFTIRGDGSSMSSHLILKDPLEEPQPTYIEERGKLNFNKEVDERTIWTGDCVPLMASYNKAKLQHSLWVVETINSNIEMGNSRFPDVPLGVLTKQFSFRRIWQGKGSQTAASKVFLATDDDASPIICLLLQEQKKLLSLRLQTVEINTEVIYDIKPDMSWSIPAISAAPVVVTRPGVKVAGLPFVDIVVLTSENTLLLYCGKQCLCEFKLSHLGKDQVLHDPKIVGLADAVEERINVIVNSGRIYRCTWRRNPSSSLANDCITAMAEGLNSTLYNHFLVLLWRNGDQTYLSGADMTADSEWESFQSVIKQICKESGHTSEKLSDSVSCSSWEFLINSRYHKQYSKSYPITGLSETSIDQQGLYSPGLSMGTSDSSGSSLCAELVTETLDTLHTVYESLKLDNLRKRDLGLLVVLLCDIAAFLSEDCYLDHYIRDFPCLSKRHEVSLTSSSKRTPPSLFRWLESCLKHGYSSASISHLPSLIFRDGSSVVNWGRKIVSFYSLLCGAELLGKRLSSGVSCAIASGSFNTPEEVTVLSMVGERVGLQQLDLLPAGVSLPLRDALDKCRDSPPIDWPAAAYVLLGREDLAFSRLAYSRKSVELEPHMNVNMTCMSAPYMLNLHPVTIPSSISDTVQSEDNKLEDVDSVEGYVADGMEHIFNSGIQLRYGRDLRLNEVRRLLCSARPVVIQTPVNPSASDQDLQQAQLWQLAQRTTALPFGRGAFTLATTCTLLTEALTVPKLILAGRLPAQQNATVNLDPNVRNVQELKSWPEFHNAVAAGLRLAPPQGKMSRTWILYNKPEEPSVVHAGLLLALGLHGHLRVLTITDIYQYYSQEHESTTVGLMLGLAASYRGTMQPAISKSLYVHIPSRHPSSFPELELPTLLQSAALLSVGLLYEGSAHPQTMQILLGEIGRRSGGDNVLEREGYAVAAGFSLGLVALGRGEDAPGFVDALVDRLFLYIGGKEPQNERSHLFVPSIDELNRSAGQIMDGTAVNVDVTAPGATIALALMFLKTESELVYSRLSVPQTHFDLHYVRPDFIMLRVIARNMIMWSRVHASEEWIQSQIPEVIQNGVKGLGDTMSDTDEMNSDAFVQAYVHIVVGACISLGLRYAGSRDGNLQELLYKYALYFLNEIKPVSVSSVAFPKGLSRYIDRGSLETCLHLIVLSLCVVMAGSGHLQTFKLLKYLRGRNSADGHLSFGNQMAVSLAIGFLFIGGGMQTFSTSKSSIAALLITLYPRLPTGPNDNRCHLQAFRHLYVLATEARWVQTVDVDSGLPVYCPLEVTVRETEHYAETSFYEVTPCILPERAVLKAVRVCGPRYWSQVINHIPEEKPWSSGDKGDALSSGILYVKRKVGACSYVDDPAGCQSLLSRAMHKVFGLTRLRASAASKDCQDGDMVDQLIGTFSSNPSLISFAQLCCDPNWNSRSDIDFQEFCLQVLFECVSKDRPALLQVYLSLYTTIGSMVDRVTSDSSNLQDTLFISSLKIALAYNNSLLNKRSTSSKEGIVQLTFLGSVQKRVEEILSSSLEFQKDFCEYMKYGRWPTEDYGRRASTLLSWYVQWYNVPSPFQVKRALDKIKEINTSSSVPLLHLLFPTTDVAALYEINRIGFCSRG